MAARILAFLLVWLAWPLPAPAQAQDRHGPDFSRLVREQGAAVVNLSISYRVPWESPMPDLPGEGDEALLDEFLRRFYGPHGPRRFDGESVGSGFVISQDGYVLTNAHLVMAQEPRDIIVRMSDRREFEARLVGADAASDIALLKVDAEALQPVRIGDPERLEVGQWVAAIGSPFGFEQSVTAGIVSAKGRSVPEEPYVPFLQTDVAVNPGNSGGPLFNLRGEVVGINSMIYSGSGGYMGMAFAIPIDFALEIAAQLRAAGKVVRGGLDVRVQDVSADLARALRLPRPAGALVSDIAEDSGVRALRPGDVIVRFGGKPVESVGELLPLVARARPGSRVEVAYLREGKPGLARVRIIERDELEPPYEPPAQAAPAPLVLEVSPPGVAERARLGLEGGLVVRRADGEAQRAGLRRGDVILAVDGLTVTTEEALRKQLAAAGPVVALRVQRGRVRVFLSLRVDARR